MKTLLKSLALSLLLGAGVCATTAAKSKNHDMKPREVVSLIPLHYQKGFAVRVDKMDAGKSMVIIYDQDGTAIFKDQLTKGTIAEKKYILSNLDNGDYTVEVFSKNHDIQTKFFVYHVGNKKVTRLS
jgi:hypothetical protein